MMLAVLLPAWLGAAAWIDSRKLVLPDALTLPLIPVGFVLSLVSAPSLIDRVIGAAAGFLVLAAFARLYRRVRHQDGLGLDDAKLLAGAGAWVGWEDLPALVLISAAAALLWTLLLYPDPARPTPFGPFLAIGFWLVWQFGPLGFG